MRSLRWGKWCSMLPLLAVQFVKLLAWLLTFCISHLLLFDENLKLDTEELCINLLWRHTVSNLLKGKPGMWTLSWTGRNRLWNFAWGDQPPWAGCLFTRLVPAIGMFLQAIFTCLRDRRPHPPEMKTSLLSCVFLPVVSQAGNIYRDTSFVIKNVQGGDLALRLLKPEVCCGRLCFFCLQQNVFHLQLWYSSKSIHASCVNKQFHAVPRHRPPDGDLSVTPAIWKWYARIYWLSAAATQQHSAHFHDISKGNPM